MNLTSVMTQDVEASHKQHPLCNSVYAIVKHNQSVILEEKSCPKAYKGREREWIEEASREEEGPQN